MDHLVKCMLEGERRALSRLITLVEKGDPSASAVMETIHAHTGRVYCVGITGPPGSGKSTLVNRLTELMRRQGLSVGIIAVDPSSPYSGGALLGDRIRMQRHYLDSGVFIRSMSTRGQQGGLPRVIKSVVRLLDAAGKEFLMVETVGVGQTELKVMDVADTVVVTLMPESGDVVQTLKAGLMEIGDIFVINKADRPGASQAMAAVKDSVEMLPPAKGWTPPVLATQADQGSGVPELYHSIQKHRQFLERTSKLEHRRRERRKKEFLEMVQVELERKVEDTLSLHGHLSQILEAVERGEADPYSSALKLIQESSFLDPRPPPSSL